MLLSTFLAVSLSGCVSISKPASKQPAVEVAQQEPREERRQQEAQQQAVARAKWKLEAEKKALAARQREAEKARKRAEEKRQQAIELRRKEEEQRKQVEARKRAEKAARKVRAEALIKQVEQSLEEGDVAAAEQQLAEYRTFVGERVLKQERFQSLRQKIITTKQMLADLEQASVAEQYLQQLMDEALVLEQQGAKRAARERYREILETDPGHRGAQEGIALLEASKETVKKETPVVQARPKPASQSKPKPKPKPKPKSKSKSKSKPKPKKSSLLGSKAEGWVVQVATYPGDGKKQAYALLGTIKKSGFRAVFIKKQELAGRQLYRVRIGAYGEREEADRIRERLQQKMAELGIKVASRVMQQKF